MASTADTTAGMIALDMTPFQITPCPPTAAIVAPTMPPISACEELDGMPSSHVEQVPDDAADQAGEHQFQGHDVRVDQPLGDRGGHRGGQERTYQVQHSRKTDRDFWLQGATGYRGCHGIAGVVKAVREVER